MSSSVTVVSWPAKRKLNQVKASPVSFCDQLPGEQLWRDLEVAGLSAELGQERLRGAVAGVRRQIWREIFERFGSERRR